MPNTALTAVADAAADLATAIRNMLDDQAEPEPGGFLDGLISASEAAARLGVSRQRVHALVSEGKLPSGRHGGRVLIPSDAVAERIERKSADVPAGPAPTIEPKPDVPINLDSLGLGAVIRAWVFRPSLSRTVEILAVRSERGGLPWITDDAAFQSANLLRVEVLHPGITIGGEGA